MIVGRIINFQIEIFGSLFFLLYICSVKNKLINGKAN